jgi:hypothetical protein
VPIWGAATVEAASVAVAVAVAVAGGFVVVEILLQLLASISSKATSCIIATTHDLDFVDSMIMKLFSSPP